MSDYDTLIKQSELNAAIEHEEFMLFSLLKPRIFIDGAQWCVLIGDDIQSGVAGFGSSPAKAVYDFNNAWRKELPAAPVTE